MIQFNYGVLLILASTSLQIQRETLYESWQANRQRYSMACEETE